MTECDFEPAPEGRRRRQGKEYDFLTEVIINYNHNIIIYNHNVPRRQLRIYMNSVLRCR